MTTTPFQLYAPISAFKKSGDGSRMWIGGIISTDELDRQAERVVQDGLDFSQFLKHGWFNDNHRQGTDDVVGHPVLVKRIRPGDQLPNGEIATVNGWWAEGYLIDTEKGRAIFELARSLEGTGRSLGFSIEGKVVERKGNVIRRAVIHNVAVTHCPVNVGTNLIALAKALTAGSAVAAGDLSGGPGDGGALRQEHLDGTTPGKKGKKGKKGGDNPTLAQVPAMTTQAMVEEWSEALAQGVSDMGDPDDVKLTKSEADVVVRHLYPRIPRERVAALTRG